MHSFISRDDRSAASIKPRRCVKSGMTIFEVLIASVLMTFVIAGSIGALSSGMSYARHARMTTLSSQICQTAMEQLRLGNFSSVATYSAQTQPVNFDSVITSDNFSSNYTSTLHVNVDFTTLVASNPASSILGKVQAVVTTSWTENNATFTRKTMTIFTEKGMSDYIYAGWSGI